MALLLPKALVAQSQSHKNGPFCAKTACLYRGYWCHTSSSDVTLIVALRSPWRRAGYDAEVRGLKHVARFFQCETFTQGWSFHGWRDGRMNDSLLWCFSSQSYMSHHPGGHTTAAQGLSPLGKNSPDFFFLPHFNCSWAKAGLVSEDESTFMLSALSMWCVYHCWLFYYSDIFCADAFSQTMCYESKLWLRPLALLALGYRLTAEVQN